MPSPPPDPDKIAQALHLRSTQPDLSLRQIAERIGVKSPTTAANYIEIGENAQRWFPASRRQQLSGRTDMLMAELMVRLLARLDEPDAVPEKVSPAIMEVVRELHKKHGLYAPSRVITETVDESAPDPETTAAIRAALDQLMIKSGEDDDGPGDGT